MKRILVSLFVLAALVVANVLPVIASSPANDYQSIGDTQESVKHQGDDRADPLTTQQKELKQQALEAQLNGKANGKTHEVAKGQYVELDRTGEDEIWTVLGEFNDLKHNVIAQPDRAVDNTTLWVPDFSRDHFLEMLFNQAPGANSMSNFYIEQSANRYTVNGDVTDWVPVPGDAAGYDDDLGGPAVWQFLQDSINGWYTAELASGKTPDEINAYLSRFDQWDRYDYDGDGNFDEPDGYIDHFQSIHAGEGNEAGGGVLGDSAIWSHSWYAYSNLPVGPDFNKDGGVRIGDSNYWVGKYTIQPENGGVGVFAHEFGHDLGLPDLYDTAGGENGTGFWTLMSSGSWLGDGTEDIGSKPGDMGVWEKFQLGWLNYQVAGSGQNAEFKLGPANANTKQAQGLFVVLPQKEVVVNIGAPYEGSNYYYSGSGDNLDNLMYKSFDLAAGSQLTAKVKYNIELDWDYAYVVVSTDGGTTWAGVPTNLSADTDPNGQNLGNGITGSSRSRWVNLSADLSAFSGNVLLGFRYWTDSNTGGYGFMVDNISLNAGEVDGAEADAGWTIVPAEYGFRVTNGTESRLYDNYYVAEFRQYRGFDSTLKVGPYNFGFLDNPELGNWVEHFPYQDGLLINYWDTSQSNNNTSSHPGSGLLLPVDAHPTALKYGDNVWRNRIQTYDATFSLEKTDALNLHLNSQAYKIPSQPAVKVFDDRNSYYDEANPRGSVIVPNTGTQIRIQSVSAQGSFMQVEVRPAK